MLVEGIFVKIHHLFLNKLRVLFQSVHFIDSAGLAAEGLLLSEPTIATVHRSCTVASQAKRKQKEGTKCSQIILPILKPRFTRNVISV